MAEPNTPRPRQAYFVARWSIAGSHLCKGDSGEGRGRAPLKLHAHHLVVVHVVVASVDTPAVGALSQRLERPLDGWYWSMHASAKGKGRQEMNSHPLPNPILYLACALDRLME